MATVSTHDLPTVLGFLRGEHVRARAELGLLDDVAAEEAKAPTERGPADRPAARARACVTGAEPGEDELVLAVHALLARARSRLVLVAPYDVLGEVRQPNLPGTVDEYPNWRLPLPVSVEELRRRPAGPCGHRPAAPAPLTGDHRRRWIRPDWTAGCGRSG